MSEKNMQILAQRVDQLIDACRQLDEQNRYLLTQNGKLKEERAQLLKNYDETRSRVESMLTRLKTLEQNS